MSLRKLTLSAIFLSAVEGGLAQSLTLGEHMVLRGYTGKAFWPGDGQRDEVE